MSTRVHKAWASVTPGEDIAVVTLQYTGTGKIDTLIRNCMKAINSSAGVAVRHYTRCEFIEWGKTAWAHETGADYHQVTATYKMER